MVTVKTMFYQSNEGKRTNMRQNPFSNWKFYVLIEGLVSIRYWKLYTNCLEAIIAVSHQDCYRLYTIQESRQL